MRIYFFSNKIWKVNGGFWILLTKKIFFGILIFGAQCFSLCVSVFWKVVSYKNLSEACRNPAAKAFFFVKVRIWKRLLYPCLSFAAGSYPYAQILLEHVPTQLRLCGAKRCGVSKILQIACRPAPWLILRPIRQRWYGLQIRTSGGIGSFQLPVCISKFGGMRLETANPVARADL